MRILVVTSQFPIAGDPLRGRPILQTVRELSQLAEVTVASPVAVYPRWALPGSYPFHAPDDAFQPLAGVTTRYVRYRALPRVSRAFNGWSCAGALARSLPNDRYDAVLAYWMYPDAFGALRWARRNGLPIVVGTRGSDLLVPNALTFRQTRQAVRDADRVLAVSRPLAEVASTRYGAQPERVTVIPNGCDTEVFRPMDRAAARDALGIARSAQLVVYVGRLVPEKGLKELVAAAASLSAGDGRLTVALLGEGPMRAALQAQIAEQRAPVTLQGASAPGQVALWMAAADLVTLPSYSEGNPNVVIEALACGRPVVATRVPGIVAATDDDTAVLVAPRDVMALTDGLRAAFARRWDEAGIAARHARSWAQVARETLAECERVVAAGPRRQAS